MPSRIALVSDVHSNLPAFKAVLEDAKDEKVDEVWCLGDLVGYGASPLECVELAKRECSVCLAGNHDLVVTGGIDIADFSRNGRCRPLDARQHRRRRLSASSRASTR